MKSPLGSWGAVARRGATLKTTTRRLAVLLRAARVVALVVLAMCTGRTEDAPKHHAAEVVSPLRLVAHLGGRVRAVAVDDGYVYAAMGCRVLVIDARTNSDSAAVASVGPFQLRVADVAVAGDFLYVANEDDGLRIISLADRRAPKEIGSWRPVAEEGDRGWGFFAARVAASEGYAYVVDRVGVAHVIDVRQPERPKKCAEFCGGDGLTVKGKRAYVSFRRRLLIVDIERPWEPRELGSVELPGYNHVVAVSGKFAFVAAQREGLRIVDVSDPTKPEEVGFCDTPGWALGVDVSDGYAYVADGRKGLRVISISNPESPKEVGYWDTAGTARAVAAQGRFAYVADDVGGLWVVDVGEPTRPVGRTVHDVPRWALGVVVAGNCGYVADARKGLVVLDISDPRAPAVCGLLDSLAPASAVAVSGKLAYVANLERGLSVVDISDRRNPVLLGRCDTTGTALGVAVAGNWAYVADGDAGLAVIDVSDPRSPRHIRTYNLGAWAEKVLVQAGMAHVSIAASGFQFKRRLRGPYLPQFGVMCDGVEAVAAAGDIGYRCGEQWIEAVAFVDRERPSVVWETHYVPLSFDGSEEPEHVCMIGARTLGLGGDLLYVAGQHAELEVYDVRKPTSPVFLHGFPGISIASWFPKDYAMGIAVASGCAYIACGREGVLVVAPSGGQ